MKESESLDPSSSVASRGWRKSLLCRNVSHSALGLPSGVSISACPARARRP